MKKTIFLFGFILSIVYSSNIYSQCITGDCNNGEGTLKYTNATYIGEFKNGKRNGYGELTFNNGIVSKGTFYNDNCCFGFNEYQQSPTSDGFVNYSMRYYLDSSENHFQSNLSFKYYSSSFYFFNKSTNELTYDFEKIPLPIFDILYDKKKNFEKSRDFSKTYELVRGLKISPTEVILVISEGYWISAGKPGAKYWIGILNLNSGEISKSFGSFVAPISTKYDIQLIDFVNDNLIFRTDVVKSLNIKTSVITAISLDSDLYKKTLKNKSIKNETDDGLSELTFYDAFGNLIKKIPLNENQTRIRNDYGSSPSEILNTSIYTILRHTNGINVYDRSGNLIQSKNDLTGYFKFAVSPDNEKIIISSSENISEYKLIDLNNPINVYGKNPHNASGATVLTPVKYSNTGKYVQIGQIIYFNNKPYFGTWDVAHFSPNDRSLFISNGKETILYDLEERKPIGKFKFENDYGEFASMYCRYFFADDYLVIAGRENYIKLNISPSDKTIQSTTAAIDRFYKSIEPSVPIAVNKEDFDNKTSGITDVNSKLSYMRSVIENASDIDLKLHATIAFQYDVISNLNININHLIYAKNESEKILKIFMENGIENSEKDIFKIESYVYILCQIKIDSDINSFNREIINLVLSTYTADTYIDKKFYEGLKESMNEYEIKLYIASIVAKTLAERDSDDLEPSYQSNTNSKSTEARDCSYCKGTGKCQNCTNKVEIRYMGSRCETIRKNEVNYGYVRCETCRGLGFKEELASKCDCPNGIGLCLGDKCTICNNGWRECRECNSGGNGDHLGECKECKGTGKVD